jgi:hypothetical protein
MAKKGNNFRPIPDQRFDKSSRRSGVGFDREVITVNR